MLLYLHLLIGCDSAEDNLREALSGKHPKTDASNDTAIFDESKSLVLPVRHGSAHYYGTILDVEHCVFLSSTPRKPNCPKFEQRN